MSDSCARGFTVIYNLVLYCEMLHNHFIQHVWPILTTEETKIKEVKGFAQSHTTREEGSQEFGPGLYGSCSPTTPCFEVRQYGI